MMPPRHPIPTRSSPVLSIDTAGLGGGHEMHWDAEGILAEWGDFSED